MKLKANCGNLIEELVELIIKKMKIIKNLSNGELGGNLIYKYKSKSIVESQ